MKSLYFMLTCILLLAGCASYEPNATQKAAANFGNKPSNVEAKRSVKRYLYNTLGVNPKLVLHCLDLSDEAWVRRSKDEEFKFGYILLAVVNNKPGCYDFAHFCDGKIYTFLFNGDKFEYLKGVERGFAQFGLINREKPLKQSDTDCDL
jgi:hypothetical protein